MSYKLQIPYKYTESHPGLSKLAYLYQIEKPVGLNCPNVDTDVALIQYMLTVWLSESPAGYLTHLGKTSVFGKIPLTGSYDMTLLGFILMFQLHKQRFGPITGQINPIDFYNFNSYGDFLLHLNTHVAFERPDLYLDLTKAPGIPAMLLKTLRDGYGYNTSPSPSSSSR